MSWLFDLPHELRGTLRSLLRAPAFVLSIIATLALGIGASTAIFSAMDQSVLRKPHPHYDRLVVFGRDEPPWGFGPYAYSSQVLPCMAHGKSFEAFAIRADLRQGFLEFGGERHGLDYGRVNPDYFSVLGSKVALGRLFTAEDFKAGAGDVVILHPLFWKEYFGSDPNIIGQHVVLEGRSCCVVGVLSKDFSAPRGMRSDLFRPLLLNLDSVKPSNINFSALARLRPGVSLAQAKAEVAVLGAGEEVSDGGIPDDIRKHPLQLKRLSDEDPSRGFGRLHGTFLGAVGFLYAIACLNAINLILVRLTARRRELGIRLALGGSRRAILRTLGLESLLLSLASGVAGLLVALILTPAIHSIFLPPTPGLEQAVHMDGRAFAFAFGFSLLTSMLMVLIPLWRISRMDPQSALKEGGAAAGEGPGFRRLREGLVALGAAMALVLLTGTGLMTRSVKRLMKVDLGFDPAGKVGLFLEIPENLAFPKDRYPLMHRLEERLQAVPGIRMVSITGLPPLAGNKGTSLLKPDGSTLIVGNNEVSPSYLKNLGLKLLKGRWLPDHPEGPSSVVVINQALARKWFASEDPIGRSIPSPYETQCQVIGLVADEREKIRGENFPQIYYPYWQVPYPGMEFSLLLNLSTSQNTALIQSVKKVIHEVEPRIAMRTPVYLEEEARRQIARERFVLVVLQWISGVALGLAALGLFSVMAYSVSRRMREFGIRVAMGASPKQVFLSILRRGLVLTGIGVVVGLGCAWALTRFIQSLLFETSSLDVTVYLSTSLLLLVVAALACWIPAKRAARVNPSELLKAE